MFWWIAIPWIVFTAAFVGLLVALIRDRSEGAIAVGVFLTLLAFIAGLTLSISLPIEQKTCNRLGESLGVPVAYEVVGGCYAQIGDRLVPTENLRFVDNAGNLIIEIDSDN